MAHAYAYCLKRAPVPKWYKLQNAVKSYGTKAVFGRDVLSYNEIKSMTIVGNVITSFESREHSKDWVKWEESNPEMTEILAMAAREFKKRESEWQNEYK